MFPSFNYLHVCKAYDSGIHIADFTTEADAIFVVDEYIQMLAIPIYTVRWHFGSTCSYTELVRIVGV